MRRDLGRLEANHEIGGGGLTLTGSPNRVPPNVSPIVNANYKSVTVATSEEGIRDVLTSTQRKQRHTQSTRTEPAERHVLGVVFQLNARHWLDTSLKWELRAEAGLFLFC